MSLSDDIRKEDEITELRAALKKAQQGQYKAKRANEIIVEAVYAAARESAIACGPGKALKTPVQQSQKDTRKTKPEVALVHATDYYYFPGASLGSRSASF